MEYVVQISFLQVWALVREVALRYVAVMSFGLPKLRKRLKARSPLASLDAPCSLPCA